MYYSVVKAEHVDGYKLAIRFEDGTSGVMDFSRYVRRGGVFRALRDLKVFKNFSINPDFGVICWGNLDIAPETLYAEVAGSGREAGLRRQMAVAEKRGRYGSRGTGTR